VAQPAVDVKSLHAKIGELYYRQLVAMRPIPAGAAADLERLHKYVVEIKGIKSSPSCAITLSRTHSAAPATLIAKA
jgi:hypothetical protein